MRRTKKVFFVSKYFFSVFIKWSIAVIIIMAIIILPVLLFTAFLK
tara:strand:- start:517 stop:651 length:135 start_codon:yes stop_codon:yes gene_type:complete